MSALPDWAPPLQSEIEARPDAGFRWLAPDVAPRARDLLLQGFDQFPFGDDFQDEGRRRILRSHVLALGPSRAARLTQSEQTVALLFDPEQPSRVFASLGVGLPPLLWPSADPTLAGVLGDLAPYLSRPARTRAALAASARVVRGSLEEIGVESIEALAGLLARVEPWLDGTATWGSACDDDPWPDDPTSCSMLQLRVIAERAREQHPGRRRSVAMRSLWSRSVLVVEHGPFEAVTFELRYDPAPLVARLPAGDGPLLVPEDLPVDLLASLIRGGSTTAESMARVRAEGVTPHVGMVMGLIDPGEATTYEILRELAAQPEHHARVASLAADLGAEGLLFELGADDRVDPALREEIARWVAPAAPEDPAEDEDEDEDQEDAS